MDKVICKLCGKEFKSITNTHLKKHWISLVEYMVKYDKNIRPKSLKYKMYKNHSAILKKNRKNWIVIPPSMSEENKNKASIRMKKANPMKNPIIAAKVWKSNLWRINKFWRTKEHSIAVSKRMKENNPMKNPEVVRKNWLSHKNKKSWFEILFEGG